MPDPVPASLFESLYDRFLATPELVEAFGHDEDDGPHKFWLDAVDSGAEGGPGVPVPPPYIVYSDLGSGPGSITFGRAHVRSMTVLLKTFAMGQAEAHRLGELVNAALLYPSRSRTPHRWDGGREIAATVIGDRTTMIPGRGVAGRQLYGRYSRFAVLVAGQY